MCDRDPDMAEAIAKKYPVWARICANRRFNAPEGEPMSNELPIPRPEGVTLNEGDADDVTAISST